MNPHSTSKIAPKSYGGIVISKTPEGKGEDVVLLQRQRDTYSYIGFLCGDYTEEQLPSLFDNMTVEEKDRILDYIHDFDMLWEDLFINTHYRKFRNMYPYAKETFERMKPYIEFYIEMAEQSGELLWQLPRGRVKRGHDIITTIITEIKEETWVDVKPEDFVSKAVFSRSITGLDGRKYHYEYRLIHLETPTDISKCKIETPNGIREESLSHETSEAGWFTFDEAKKMVSDSIGEVLEEARMHERVSNLISSDDIDLFDFNFLRDTQRMRRHVRGL